MNAGEAFCVQFLPDALKILESAAAKSLTYVKESEDADLAEYLKKLRETLVESYTTIVHGVNDNNTKIFLAQYAPNILKYLSET